MMAAAADDQTVLPIHRITPGRALTDVLGSVSLRAAAVGAGVKMQRILLFLTLAIAVIVAASVNGSANAASKKAAFTYSPKQCYYGPGTANSGSLYSYKYSGIYHNIVSNNPTFVANEGRVNMVTDYWSFSNTGSHILVYYNVGNNGTATSGGDTNYWIQTGLIAGYDPWSNKFSQNYPVGNWSDATHPWDGHSGGNRGTLGNGPVYTPTLNFVLERFAEQMSPAGYFFGVISTNFPLSTGYTNYAVTNSANHFSIYDQDNHAETSILSNVYLPPASVHTGYNISSDQESMNFNGNVQTQCSYGDFRVNNLYADNSTAYWNFYAGCSVNGWSQDHPSWGGLDNQIDGNPSAAHPACKGGQASTNAPLDLSIACNSDPTGVCGAGQTWQQVEFYMGETLVPPHSPRAQSDQGGFASANAPSSSNPGAAPLTTGFKGTGPGVLTHRLPVSLLTATG